MNPPSAPPSPPAGATTEFLENRPSLDPVPEAAFGLVARGLAGSDPRVVSATVVEALSTPYEAVVEICSTEPVLDLDVLLGERAVLTLVRGPRLRRVCGIIRRVERLDSWGDQRRGRLWMVPALWVLSQRSDSRIFQNLTAIEIVVKVLTATGRTDLSPALDLRRSYPTREYCVQYRETDLAFVMRLLEEEGVTYYFRHEGEAETLVLTDAPTWSLVPTMNRKPVPFSPPQAGLAHVEAVSHLGLARELRPTGVVLKEYDFSRPSDEIDLTRSRPAGVVGPRALFEYPGNYTLGKYSEGTRSYTAHDGARQAEIRHQEELAAEQQVSGDGNVTGFMPGRALELLGHELPDLDQRYLLTRVEHHLRAPEELYSAPGETAKPANARGADRYHNVFACVPASVAWVPARRTPRPMVLAAQTATVTGPPGEEVHVDAHGRIKVHFHWDRAGARDDTSSCWVRVAQAWAGAGWGTMFIPRVGMEVVVHFLEGDPDRPIVTGCVYNGAHTTPYALPEEKTRSTVKTSSSPGGNGYNELRFEDLAGSEEIFLHGQKDFNTLVEHDVTTVIHHDETATVDGNRSRTVKGNESLVVHRNRTLQVVGNQSVAILGVASEVAAMAAANRQMVQQRIQQLRASGPRGASRDASSGDGGDPPGDAASAPMAPGPTQARGPDAPDDPPPDGPVEPTAPPPSPAPPSDPTPGSNAAQNRPPDGFVGSR